MKSAYDKLFLVIAVLAFAGSLAFLLTRQGSAEPSSEMGFTPTGGAYEPIQFEAAPPASASWELPEEQSTGVTFDVFTPPKIWIDPETNEFIFQEPRGPAVEEPFGVYLVDVRRDLYRFQFQGFTEVDPTDPSTSILFIYDIENERQINARKGRDYPEDGFSIRNFVVERIEDEGTITRRAQVTLHDIERDREIVMLQGEQIFDNTVTVELASREDPDFTFTTDRANVTFSNALGEYTLLNINLDSRTVTVEKAETEDFPAKRRVLSPDAGASEPEEVIPDVPEAPTAEPSGGDDMFDSLFN